MRKEEMSLKYTYTFDQLREDIPEAEERRFLDYGALFARYGGVNTTLYRTVDFGTVKAETEIEACERLFRAYNSDVRPEGYEGRSMSVGDIVVLWNNDRPSPVKSVWFCDSVGFVLHMCAPSGRTCARCAAGSTPTGRPCPGKTMRPPSAPTAERGRRWRT